MAAFMRRRGEILRTSRQLSHCIRHVVAVASTTLQQEERVFRICSQYFSDASHASNFKLTLPNTLVEGPSTLSFLHAQVPRLPHCEFRRGGPQHSMPPDLEKSSIHIPSIETKGSDKLHLDAFSFQFYSRYSSATIWNHLQRPSLGAASEKSFAVPSFCDKACGFKSGTRLPDSNFARNISVQRLNTSIPNSSLTDIGKKLSLTSSLPGEPREDQEKASKTNLETTWIYKHLPPRLQPFAQLARLDKPVGTWLLAWPCFWSIALAAPTGQLPDVAMISLFGAGALLLRGAGCTVNDLLDRQIDVQVARTRSRPLAAGTVTSFQAVAFLGAQLLLGLGILLQLNTFSQVLGASSLFLVFTYPLMKRVTYWPQAYLGLTFNWGALLGWAAVRGSLELPVVLPLYVACISWTLVYDTIYAHQDKNDDLKVGVKSTALLFGKHTPIWLAGFSSTTIGGLAFAGHMAGLGWAFPVSLLAAGGHLAWQVGSVDYNSQSDCSTKFVSNKWLGAIVFGGVLMGKLTSPI